MFECNEQVVRLAGDILRIDVVQYGHGFDLPGFRRPLTDTRRGRPRCYSSTTCNVWLASDVYPPRSAWRVPGDTSAPHKSRRLWQCAIKLRQGRQSQDASNLFKRKD